MVLWELVQQVKNDISFAFVFSFNSKQLSAEFCFLPSHNSHRLLDNAYYKEEEGEGEGKPTHVVHLTI